MRNKRKVTHMPIATATTPDDLLLLLRQFHYLSIRQITRLLGKETSSNNIRSKMKKLVAAGLVEVTSLPRSQAGGTMPFVYSLSKKGLRTLSEAEGSGPSHKSGIVLAHTLSINDVAILATLLPRVEPRITLCDLRLESALKKYPIALGNTLFVVPDAFCQFLLTPPLGTPNEPLGILFEIDRNTEDIYQVKEKIGNYLALSAGPYQDYFQLESLTICFVITVGGQARLQQLLTWTEQELTKQQAVEFADLFLFYCCEPAALSPRSFFCAPVWSQPFTAALLPLIEQKIP
jgi:Replication-relaxation